MSLNWFLLNAIETSDNIVSATKAKTNHNLIYILKLTYNLAYKINSKTLRFILTLKKCVIKGEMIKNQIEL